MIVTFTSTGIVSSGTENTGVFGPANANLTGKAFSLTASVDDTKGIASSSVGSTAISTGDASAITAAVTVNGKTYTYPISGSGQSSLSRVIANPHADLFFFHETPDGDSGSDVAISIASTADNAPYFATDNWEAPFPTYTLIPETLLEATKCCWATSVSIAAERHQGC